MYSLSAIEHFDGSNTTVVIGGMQDVTVDANVTHILESGTGSVDNTHISVMDVKPTISFSSTDVKKLLDLCGIDALAIGSVADDSTMTFWLRRRAPGGIYDGGNTHIKMTINEGILVPNGIDVALDGVASAKYEVTAIYDGTNVPVVIEKDQAFTPTIPIDDVRWTVGPWFFNGVAFAAGSIQSTRIDFGLTIETIKGDGEIYPIEAHIISRAPTMECDTLDISIFDDDAAPALGIIGAKITGITRAFLRKKDFGGLNVAPATAEHISFEIGEGRVMVNSVNATHQDNATASVTVTPVDTTPESGTAIMVVNTADAISGA